MADEEMEVLDWGNEDDEQLHPSHRGEVEEDAVSLGGDEDDNDMQAFYAYQARSEQESTRASAPTPKPQQQSHKRDMTSSSQNVAPSPVSVSQSQSQQSHSTLRRNSSQPKLTHELPPKPILAVAPSVKETSTLASSMARHDRERRLNGKPHSSSDDQLPPEWELRYPRHGGSNPYYYNTKTEVSQWERPSGVRVREKERGRSPARDIGSSRSGGDGHKTSDHPVSSRSDIAHSGPRSVSASGLSYDDRHYRPGSSPRKSTEEASNKQEGASNVPSSRARSPAPRGARELHRDQRGRLNRNSVTSVDRPSGTQTRSHERPPEEAERMWIPRDAVPPEPVQVDRDERVVLSRRKRHDSDPPRREPVTPREQTTRRDYSPPRYRSPSPMLRPSAAWTSQESSAYEPAPSPHRPPLLSRQDSRAEHLAAPSIEDKQPRPRREEYDSYAPVDSVPQRRGREPELTSPQMDGENETKRRRIDDASSDRPGSRFSGLPPKPLDEEPPHRKRAPLPPQSERFREAANKRPAPPPPQSPSGAYPEPGPSYAGGGPRNQYPPPSAPVRDASHPDFAQGRLPPSGPSAGSTRTRPSRFQNDAVPPQFLDRDAMEIDIALPRSVSTNRAGPSTYDRDPQESLPKGPRAMAHRLSTSGYPAANATAPSPTAMYPSRQVAQQEMLPPRLRDRSPPPHFTRSDARGTYPTPVTAEMPSRFDGSASFGPRDVHQQEVPDARKVAPVDFPKGRRQSETKPPSSTLGVRPKLSGTNSVPIANKRMFGAAPVAPPPLPNAPMSVDRYVARSEMDREPPPRSRYVDDEEQKNTSYERGGEDYGPRSAGPESYRMNYPRQEETRTRAPTGDHLELNRRPVSPVSSNGGKVYQRNFATDNRYQEAPPALGRRSRFDTHEARTPVDSHSPEARIWTPRGVTPPPPPQPRPTYTREPEYRPATPPPPSREPSLSWRASQESMDDYAPPVRSQERIYQDNRPERTSFRASDNEREFYSRPPSITRTERDERDYYATDPSRGPRPSSVEGYPRGQYGERHAETSDRLEDNDLPQRSRPEHRQVHPEEPSSSGRKTGSYHRYPNGSRQNSRWDRPEADMPRQEDSPAVTAHPERAPMFEDVPEAAITPNTDPEFSRTSKPVRIRRPQNSQTPSQPIETLQPPAEGRLDNKKRYPPDRIAIRRGDESFERPNMHRGGSLLDRLSVAPPHAATSLRDRVQLNEHDSPEVSLLPGGEYPGEANDSGPSDLVAKKQKRRAGKPKRGRRGGP
ncbi:hypothetical protein NEOLEDRAFT_1183847 [Neolentinus lepideus HHB14362 ss-1]|uniref:WW domain-containing protein n=1 Tax=Neolentinus lepideus HHB14362 ss-1 TaxID=1314782 RepID=A0A165MYH3_9AGAM|nr:hypothetical protein NEOLEDRAFT_1183847 [Neolentinus lepideus HHB14362 ss-1]